MFDIRNRQYVVWMMVAILVFIGLIVVDLVFFPRQKSSETLVSYGLVTAAKSKEVVGYRYWTNEGSMFLIEKDFIRGEAVVLERTLLFKQIVDVKTPTRDYTGLLASGFSGFSLVLLFVLAFSCVISLMHLWGTAPLSVDRYQNFVMFTAFVFFCTASMWLLFN